MLVVVDTHPVQYRAPVYRDLTQRCGVPLRVLYGSDFSTQPYRDREFDARMEWDVDLVGGYDHTFLERVAGSAGRDDALPAGRGMYGALRRIRPDAVLVCGYSPAFHRRAWAAACALGIPILFRAETTDLGPRRQVVRECARRIALRTLYRLASRVLYIGERSRRHFRQLGVREARMTFSPYCVATTAFEMDDEARARRRPRTRAAWEIAEGDVVLVFSGKLSVRKGVDLLVTAAQQLPRPLRERVVVLLSGDGQLRDRLIADAALMPGVRIRWIGVQSQRALSDVYHASDLLVLPSRHGETWGLVVNEALHHGLPVVVSDQVGCALDLVDEQTGEVSRADDAPALAAAIVRAQRLVGRPDVRYACRQKVAGYTVALAADGIAEAYRRVTRGPA